MSLTQVEFEIVEENNYYPFGLKHRGYNNTISSFGNSVAQQYKFGGKEYQEELGLDWYDITARNYDPALGRWMNLDPLAELMMRQSPYNFALNNPIYYKDTDGRSPKGMFDPYLVFNGKENKIYIYDDNDTPNDSSDDVLIGSFDAHNIVASDSQGKWENGLYSMLDKNTRQTRTDTETNPSFSTIPTRTILQDSRNGRYGQGGIYRARNFTQSNGKKRSGMAIHAGREYKDFLDRCTNGCIRTTPEAMLNIDKAILKYGPLQYIKVKENLPVTPRPTVTPLPVTPSPVSPIPVPSFDPGGLIPVLPEPTPIVPEPIIIPTPDILT